MKVEQISLQERLILLNSGCFAHPECAAAAVYHFANLYLTEYFQGFEQEFTQLTSALGLSQEQAREMTYKQLAKYIDDKLSVTPSCGDGYLYDAVELLVPPLLDSAAEREKQQEVSLPMCKQSLFPARPLEERLAADLTPRDCMFLHMGAGSLIQFMDDLVAPCAARFASIHDQYFQPYDNEPVSKVAAASLEMPEEERQAILYELLIHPFAALEEYPNKRYCP